MVLIISAAIGAHIYKINQYKGVDITSYPFSYREPFVYQMAFIPRSEEAPSYYFEKANCLTKVKFESPTQMSYQENNGKSLLTVDFDYGTLGTMLELFRMLIQNDQAGLVKIHYSKEQIDIESSQMKNLKFSLVSSSRANELTVNPPAHPDYVFFNVKTNAKKLTMKLSGKRDENNYAEWLILDENQKVIKKVTAY
ncbi:hypothetical protein [Listeria floridensis]|uniref:hypothetical protein n=1 Tax=Listeria floridensis TaxID=1494962 RepID=UPI0011EA5083|nr:hypothetical protein [Listeria floridensis]